MVYFFCALITLLVVVIIYFIASDLIKTMREYSVEMYLQKIDELHIVINNKNAYICVLENRLGDKNAT